MSASLVRCVPSVFALPPSGWTKELQEAGRWILCAREVSQPLGLKKITLKIVLRGGRWVALSKQKLYCNL